MNNKMRIAVVQMDVALAEVDRNLEYMLGKLSETTASGAKLTVFPECSQTGYCFDSLEQARPYAEPIPGPGTERMAAACQRLQTFVVYGLLEADGDRVFNAAALVGPQGLIGHYRKIHLPHLGIDHHTTPGDRPFAVHHVEEARVGLNICYDSAFPESARVMALDGADLIVLPTNFPPGAECMVEHTVQARAMENGVYYAVANRIGTEGDFRFIGQSKICDPDGNVMAEAPVDEEAVLMADIDLARARDKRRVRVVGKHYIERFVDRRPEMYEPIVAPTRPDSRTMT